MFKKARSGESDAGNIEESYASLLLAQRRGSIRRCTPFPFATAQRAASWPETQLRHYMTPSRANESGHKPGAHADDDSRLARYVSVQAGPNCWLRHVA
jgi:hypothetical protein